MAKRPMTRNQSSPTRAKMTENRATKTLKRVHSIGGRDLGIPHHRIAKVKAVLGEAGEGALEGDSDDRCRLNGSRIVGIMTVVKKIQLLETLTLSKPPYNPHL